MSFRGYAQAILERCGVLCVRIRTAVPSPKAAVRTPGTLMPGFLPASDAALKSDHNAFDRKIVEFDRLCAVLAGRHHLHRAVFKRTA